MCCTKGMEKGCVGVLYSGASLVGVTNGAKIVAERVGEGARIC